MEREASVVLSTQSEALADVVLATAAALGLSVEVVEDPRELGARWASADVVLVGEDHAAAVALEAPRRREGVFLIGFDPDALSRFSMPLGGPVIPLPDGAEWLTAVLADDHGAGAPLVAVVGGSGGVGASTLAAGLAMRARRRGLATALVDVDPVGGGIDLLLGAERTPGWRWPRLVGARGEVGDVRRFLPQFDGMTVVSMAREGPGVSSDHPSAESVRAVLGSLSRHHDLVILDAGRSPLAAVRAPLLRARRVLVVSGSDVRSVAATAATVRELAPDAAALVVRSSAGNHVPPDVVERALGLPLLGRIPDDPRLRRSADHGDPPGRSGRSGWVRAVDALLSRVLEADDGR